MNKDKILCANKDLLSYNLYLYTSNNLINYSDEEGLGIFSIITNFYKTWKSKTKSERKQAILHPIRTYLGYKARLLEKKYMVMR